jgi:hypothetical protein
MHNKNNLILLDLKFFFSIRINRVFLKIFQIKVEHLMMNKKTLLMKCILIKYVNIII